MLSVSGILSPADGSQQAEGGSSTRENVMEQEVPENSTMPAVVVYLIDPFSFGQEWSDLHRLAMVGLLRCYQQMVLPPQLQNSTFLQVRCQGCQGLVPMHLTA